MAVKSPLLSVDNEFKAKEPTTGMKEEIEEEVDYKSMTVLQIKKILKQKGLPISGKKTDLIARLKE